MSAFRLHFLLLLLFAGMAGLAQNKPKVLRYDRMPENGIDLNQGWRFSSADKPDFAQPGFDDSSWDTITPRREVPDIPQLKGVKTGWLRLHLRMAGSLVGRSLTLNTYQAGASEIYLDGKLLRRYGTVSADPAKLDPVGVNLDAQEIQFAPGKEHVLAVRFAIWPGAFVLRSGNQFLNMTLSDIATNEKQLRDYLLTSYHIIFLSSVFFLLSILHLSYFRYNPSQRANLFFSIYTLANFAGFVCVILLYHVRSAAALMWIYLFSFLLTLMATVWINEALAALFRFRIRSLLWGLWSIFAIAAVWLAFGSFTIPFFGGLFIFEAVQIWLTVKALRAKKRGAGIVATAFAVSVVSLLFIIALKLLDSSLTSENWLNTLTLLAVFLSPGLGISLYLSREFTLDSKMLQEKLAEVEALSLKTLAQEQEKQQLLATQKETLETQVAERTMQLNRSLEDLKATQAQLIQSEKMASLGELTAGIAHEIQNPLNFVNNFSEVSAELVEEAEEGIGNGEWAGVTGVLADLKLNLDKISHHGKRADMIVKGMLQHSRISTGHKEPTDLNALAEEYLRLSYHGLRAKDKNFSVTLATDFDPALPLATVVPQDIGRVLLNLFNNAFQAVAARSKAAGGETDATLPEYVPEVKVASEHDQAGITITVTDNGPGIPADIVGKIFQPFFTTKPAGEGTGLGLSLSYDIVVKGHGGKLDADSKEGELTVFRIWLPVRQIMRDEFQ